VKIVWERSIYIGNAPVFCAICGHRYYPRQHGHQLLLAIIYDDQGTVQGEACRDCVAAGPLGIRSRLDERIKSLQDKVNELQHLAQSTIETPTLEQEFQVHRGEGG
jgi:hypothetical protein